MEKFSVCVPLLKPIEFHPTLYDGVLHDSRKKYFGKNFRFDQ